MVLNKFTDLRVIVYLSFLLYGCKISVEFKTENTGGCECNLDYFIDPEVYSFVYEIKDRLIYIDNTPPYIGGGWILQKFDNDSLVIAQNQVLKISEIIKLKKLY